MTPRKPGRPRGATTSNPLVHISLTLTRAHIAHLDARGANRSEVMREIMDREIAKEKRNG